MLMERGTFFTWFLSEFNGLLMYCVLTGSLAWRVYKGVAYAGHCKVPPYTPMHMKWTEAVKSVVTVAVDENCAWSVFFPHRIEIRL